MGYTKKRRGQIGVETTPGTAVAATRQLIGMLKIDDGRTRERREIMRNSFGGAIDMQDLSYMTTAKYTARATTVELPFWLSAGMRGDPTTTSPDGTGEPYLHVYNGPLATVTDPKFLTCFDGDDAGALKAAGMFVTKIKLKGGDNKPVSLEVELTGRNIVTGTLATLSTPASEDLKSLLSKLSINDTGAAIGTTAIPGTLYDWEWTFSSGISPDYTMDGLSLDMTGILRDEPSVSLTLTAKWNTAMIAEWTKYDTLATRFIRLETTGSTIAPTYPHRLRLDGAYKIDTFSAIDGDRNGTSIVKVGLSTIEDETWGKRHEVSVQTTLAAVV